MGTLIALYCENKKKFFPCANKPELKPDGVRRLAASKYRYCLGANYFYMPAEHPELEESDKLCWVRSREMLSFEELNSLASEDLIQDGGIIGYDIRIGNIYSKRRKEVDGKFVDVDCFVAQQQLTDLRIIRKYFQGYLAMTLRAYALRFLYEEVLMLMSSAKQKTEELPLSRSNLKMMFL